MLAYKQVHQDPYFICLNSKTIDGKINKPRDDLDVL